MTELQSWFSRNKCLKRELLSLSVSPGLLATVSSTWASGFPNPGHLNSRTNPCSGRSFTPLCLLWGQQWSGKKLLFHCDNQAVVDIWASGTSRDPLIMHLVRSIFFRAATHHYTVLITHIAGTNNLIADSLSRLQITLFRRLAPTADVEPTLVPKSAPTLWHID